MEKKKKILTICVIAGIFLTIGCIGKLLSQHNFFQKSDIVNTSTDTNTYNTNTSNAGTSNVNTSNTNTTQNNSNSPKISTTTSNITVTTGKKLSTDYCAAGIVVGKGLIQEYTSGTIREKDIVEYYTNSQTANGLTPKVALQKVKAAYSAAVTGTAETYEYCVVLNNTYMQNRTYKVVYCPYGSYKANPGNTPCYEVYDDEPSSDVACVVLTNNNQVIGKVMRDSGSSNNYNTSYTSSYNSSNSTSSTQSSSKKSASDITGTYYPQISSVYPDTENYADYIIDVGTPANGQVYVKFYSRNGQTLYSGYASYEGYGNGKFYKGSFEFNTYTNLEVVTVTLNDDGRGPHLVAQRKGQITGIGCTFKKR